MTIRSLIFNPLTASLFLVLSLIIIWSVRQTELSSNQTYQALKEAEAEVNSLKIIEQEKSRQAQTAADPFTQEKIIRDDLLLQKPDESIIQLPAMPSLAPDQIVPSPTTSPLQLWLDIFLNK